MDHSKRAYLIFGAIGMGLAFTLMGMAAATSGSATTAPSSASTGLLTLGGHANVHALQQGALAGPASVQALPNDTGDIFNSQGSPFNPAILTVTNTGNCDVTFSKLNNGSLVLDLMTVKPNTSNSTIVTLSTTGSTNRTITWTASDTGTDCRFNWVLRNQ